MLKTTFVTVGLIVTSASFLYWRLSASPAPPVVTAVFTDSSGSVVKDCRVESELVRMAITKMRRTPGSTLDFYTIGAAETAYAPVLWRIGHLGFQAPKVLEPGIPDSQKSAEQYLAAVNDSCQQWRESDSSAIFTGLKHVMAQVQSERAPTSPAYVFAHTDLQELVIKSIATALTQPKGSPIRDMPAPIENSGVDVLLCGFAETRTKVHGKTYTRQRRPDSFERAREVWSAVFTDPERVTFFEFCKVEL
jgi:hypothetical protein